MSDVSVISHEYQTASDLSQRINRALLLLKKVHHNLPDKEQIALEDIQTNSSYLADVMAALHDLLAPPHSGRSDHPFTTHVPGALIARIRAERRGDLDYYLEDLSRIADILRTDSRALTDTDLALLDQVAAVADDETSSVFRRLMRR